MYEYIFSGKREVSLYAYLKLRSSLGVPRKQCIQAFSRRSQSLMLRSCEPDTSFESSRHLAAYTFAEWPVSVCCTAQAQERAHARALPLPRVLLSTRTLVLARLEHQRRWRRKQKGTYAEAEVRNAPDADRVVARGSDYYRLLRTSRR